MKLNILTSTFLNAIFLTTSIISSANVNKSHKSINDQCDIRDIRDGFVIVMHCCNFNTLSELDFSSLDNRSFKTIIIDKDLVMTNELNLAGIKLEEDFEFKLINAIGFDLNIFQLLNTDLSEHENSTFVIENSNFEFFYDKTNLIDYEKCNLNSLSGYTFERVNISNLKLGPQMTYNNLCPLIFKNVHINELEICNQISGSSLEFYNLSFPDLNSSIKRLVLKYFSNDLTLSIVNPNVFDRLESLSIDTYSKLGYIQPDFFQHFKRLKYVRFHIENFKEFIAQLNETSEWMKYLNADVVVKNQNEIKTKLNEKFIIEFNDFNMKYTYPDEDFCLFKDFPHLKLVFPIIKTKPDLNCTCTLMWLIQKYELVEPDELDLFQTPSVRSCIDKKLSQDCNFAAREINCGKAVLKTTDKPPVEENSLMVVLLSSFSALVFVSFVIGTFLFVKYKRRQRIEKENEEIKMIPKLIL